MLLSEVSKKEVLDAKQAKKLGLPGKADLVIDETTGQIDKLVFPASPLRKKSKEWLIPWKSINKIGPDFVIIDTEFLASTLKMLEK
ncbi:YlmC/YmxH family sporulation protein [Salibacterium salarium]|uniref:YlmC/YmxH family sporulation protein n=1 Tax=Salibacterium salarium TaxID=284579 RepID=A0A428N417_9BACI|nr:YlmC/YmxH family sporulation protein [Salibacterium salarium]RSL33214.1 YlmC/YmxH family sporulation protein [Salibacterium salarium]